jgi:hypothetical protein
MKELGGRTFFELSSGIDRIGAEGRMSPSFHFDSSGEALSSTKRRIFVDNTSHLYREGLDLELSHWNPNNTPDRFLADTSTEIVLNYLTLEGTPADGIVVNNHLDIDGVLSAFALLEPELAIQHHDLLIGAAETGDFWSFSGKSSLSLYQSLIQLCKEQKENWQSDAKIYEACFAALPELIEKAYQKSELGLVTESLEMLSTGKIQRRLWHTRFVSFVVSELAHQGDLERALRVTLMNSSLDDGCLLRGVVRNRRDAERIQLVSVEDSGAWFHDLYYPCYMWAETINRWRAPGFWEGDTSHTWYFRYSPLEVAMNQLREREKNSGTWQTVDELSPFTDGLGRGFPVVASFLDEDDLPARSSLSPDEVSRILCEAYTYDKTCRL